MNNFLAFIASQANRPYFYALLFADLALRGLALYRSARKDQRLWFVVLLVINTFGILPLAYLLLQKKEIAKPATRTTTKRTRKKKK